MVKAPLDRAALDQLFLQARSYGAWRDADLSDELIRQLYELARWGPTASNSCPARFVFVRSVDAKERLKRHLTPGNIEKTMSAPCCVVVAQDMRFAELMPQLFPSRDLSAVFAGKDELVAETAFRNASLQGAYLMLSARALGLDCGPMSGFNAETLNEDFFPDGRWRANFLCNIGYGEDDGLFPRNPRLAFEQACLDI